MVDGDGGYSGEKAKRLCRLVGGAGENIDGLLGRSLETVGVDSAELADEPLTADAEDADVSRREGGTNGLSVDKWW